MTVCSMSAIARASSRPIRSILRSWSMRGRHCSMSRSGKISRRMSQASHQADQRDVPGMGDVVGEQDVPDPQLHLLLNVAVDRGVAAGAERPHHAGFALHDDAAGDEALQGLLADFGRVFDRQHPDPGPRIRGRALRRNFREDGIDEWDSRWGARSVITREVGVGVDPVGEGQIHQHGAGDGAPEGGLRNRHETCRPCRPAESTESLR